MLYYNYQLEERVFIMLNVILQRFSSVIVAVALVANAISGMLGNGPVIPYNPVRTDVTVSGDVTTDKEDIAKIYNAAVEKTNQGLVIGKIKNEFKDKPVLDYSMEGSSNGMDPSLLDSFLVSFENTESKIFKVPGGDIKVSDIKSAKMSSSNGETKIIINIKDYSGKISEGDDNPISRAFGVKNDLTTDLFSEMSEMKTEYTNCKIACVINEKTGKIVYGDWDYDSSAKGENLEMSMLGFNMVLEKYDMSIAVHTDI